jgi:hypothetical protein
VGIGASFVPGEPVAQEGYADYPFKGSGIFPIIRKHLTNIVTDLINALPGNSSVNTVQHATVEEPVFSVSAVTSHNSR